MADAAASGAAAAADDDDDEEEDGTRTPTSLAVASAAPVGRNLDPAAEEADPN